MRRLLNELLRTLPSVLFTLLIPIVAYYAPQENIALISSFVLGLIAAKFFRIQNALGYLGFRSAAFYEYFKYPVRKVDGAFLIGSIIRLLIFYRGYSFYRLKMNATFLFAFFSPILFAFLTQYLQKLIALLIAIAFAIALVALSVRRVRGTLIERFFTPLGASFGFTLATYFAMPYSPMVFRGVSFVLFGLLPFIIALGLEARMLLAMRSKDI